MRVGIAHHLGWAVAVTATADHEVVDRRRIELVEPGLPVAPVHHEGGPHEMHRTGPPLSDEALASLVAEVRASAVRATTAALAELPGEIESMAVRSWPPDFPTDLATLRWPPYESRADSVMYLQVLAECALALGWTVVSYEAKDVEAAAAAVLGPERAHAVLHGPRSALGPPWAKDHRQALASTIVAAP